MTWFAIALPSGGHAYARVLQDGLTVEHRREALGLGYFDVFRPVFVIEEDLKRVVMEGIRGNCGVGTLHERERLAGAQ